MFQVENDALIGQAESLRTLNLSSNSLLDFINVADLINLQSIDLSRNRLTDIPVGVFGSATSLRQLRLEENEICAIKVYGTRRCYSKI